MKEESLFDALLTKPTPAEREAFLQAECGADLQLRNRLEKLLAGDARRTGILDASFSMRKVEATNRQIGSYHLKELLGEGGFGQVFAAEQYEPVRRDVAVKLIKPGMDSREVIARFSAERQALALMDHANIARVLEAGTTENDRPYFVMELVRGKNITEYCDLQRFTTHQRLKLFLPICQAVQHAHQKGIIHRDLKPSNILVTEQDAQPTVKVIDFGVAKALDPHQSFTSPKTRDTQLIGTPAYMSPEQAEIGRRDIDTRTDIYSLGVLLYELLAGATPFDGERWRSASFDEIRRIIREEEPPKPSLRLSTLGISATTISANRRCAPRELSRLFRGELDWIVMKSIEKERDRRYATVTELAKDIDRYLADEPVEASPPSTLYRLKKFARKHRYAVLSGSAMFVLLAGGIVGTTLGMFEAQKAQGAEKLRAKAEERERIRAVRAEGEAQAKTKEAIEAAIVSNNLVAFFCDDVLGNADVFSQFDRGMAPRPNLTMGEALEQATQKLDSQFEVQPLVEAHIRSALGQAFFQLDYDLKAIEQLKLAVTIFSTHLDPADVRLLDAEAALARAYSHHGRVPEAIQIQEKVRDLQIATLGAEDPRTLLNLGCLAESYSYDGRHLESLELHQHVYETYARKLGPNHKLTLTSLEMFAHSQYSTGNFDEAAKKLEWLLTIMPKEFGVEHPRTLSTTEKLGMVYLDQRRWKEAIAIFESLVPKVQRVWGSRAHHTYNLIMNLGITCRANGETEKAIPLLSGVFKAGLADCNLRTRAGLALTQAHLAAQDPKAAAEAMADLIKAIRDHNPPHSRALAAELLECQYVLVKMEDWEQAEARLRECLPIWELPPTDVTNLLITEAFLGEVLLKHAISIHDGPQTKALLAEAERLLLKSGVGLTTLTNLDLYTKQVRRNTIDSLIRYYEFIGNPDQANEWRQKKTQHPKSTP